MCVLLQEKTSKQSRQLDPSQAKSMSITFVRPTVYARCARWCNGELMYGVPVRVQFRSDTDTQAQHRITQPRATMNGCIESLCLCAWGGTTLPSIRDQPNVSTHTHTQTNKNTFYHATTCNQLHTWSKWIPFNRTVQYGKPSMALGQCNRSLHLQDVGPNVTIE